jgi:hypothetical protein
MFNFLIKPVYALSGIGPIGAVPTISYLYCLFVEALNWFFAFSIIIAIIMFISVGVGMMYAGGNVDARKTHLNRLYFTIVGVVVIFMAWIIVTKIIPQFLGLGTVDLESGGGLLDWAIDLIFGKNLCDILSF